MPCRHFSEEDFAPTKTRCSNIAGDDLRTFHNSAIIGADRPLAMDERGDPVAGCNKPRCHFAAGQTGGASDQDIQQGGAAGSGAAFRVVQQASVRRSGEPVRSHLLCSRLFSTFM